MGPAHWKLSWKRDDVSPHSWNDQWRRPSEDEPTNQTIRAAGTSTVHTPVGQYGSRSLRTRLSWSVSVAKAFDECVVGAFEVGSEDPVTVVVADDLLKFFPVAVEDESLLGQNSHAAT